MIAGVPKAHAIVPALVLGAVAAAAGLTGAVPMTWDEGYTFLRISSHGLAAAFTTYPMPNNHVLFSGLEALLPAQWIAHWPPLLRTFNVAFAAAMGAALGTVVSSPLLAILLGLCAPIFTLYLVLARGYLIGTIFLLGAIVQADRARPLRAGLLAGLAVACVPTFALALAGGSIALKSGRLRAAAVFAAVVAATYFAIAGEVFRQRSLWGTRPGLFLPGLIGFGHGPGQIVSMALLGIAAILVAMQRPPAQSLGLALLASAAGFVALVVVLGPLGLLDEPYPRNALFVPLFGWLGLLLLAQGRTRTAVAGLLGASAALGAVLLALAFRPGADPNRYPYLRSLTPSPLQRSLSLDFDSMAGDSMLAGLYARHKPIRPLETIPSVCFAGSIRPEPAQTVVLYRDGAPLLLCY